MSKVYGSGLVYVGSRSSRFRNITIETSRTDQCRGLRQKGNRTSNPSGIEETNEKRQIDLALWYAKNLGETQFVKPEDINSLHKVKSWG